MPLFGEPHRIEWVGGVRRVTRAEGGLAVGGPADGSLAWAVKAPPMPMARALCGWKSNPAAPSGGTVRPSNV